ncbi:MAG: hypothetical protein ACT6SG_20480, partial [Hydrogenophaga sp.]|uniref:hypothetical protein n=1 Tax=Hydrogenophaga sp. TaxID=1904254 RepID=UPI004035F996
VLRSSEGGHRSKGVLLDGRPLFFEAAKEAIEARGFFSMAKQPCPFFPIIINYNLIIVNYNRKKPSFAALLRRTAAEHADAWRVH